MPEFENILCIAKNGSEYAVELANEVRDWLESQGVRALVRENPREGCCSHELMPRPDLIIALGGDGTVFSISRAMDDAIPMIGINIGQVGFLTELHPDGWQAQLEAVLQGRSTMSRRSGLEFQVFRHDQVVTSGIAVNDLVVCRGRLARLISLDIRKGEERIGSLRADGIILSTPTGATAYSVSAGGPLIHPDLDVHTLTPICPFLSVFRPLVLPATEILSIRVVAAAEPVLTVDGQIGYPLEEGDLVHVASKKDRLLLVHPPGVSYYQTLRAKGFILED